MSWENLVENTIYPSNAKDVQHFDPNEVPTSKVFDHIKDVRTPSPMRTEASIMAKSSKSYATSLNALLPTAIVVSKKGKVIFFCVNQATFQEWLKLCQIALSAKWCFLKEILLGKI